MKQCDSGQFFPEKQPWFKHFIKRVAGSLQGIVYWQ